MNQNAGAHYGERAHKIWIGGLQCESIKAGLAMLRTMAEEPDIQYHVLYHAIRTGKTELHGVSISMSAPRAAEERSSKPSIVSDQRTQPKGRQPLLARVRTSWLGVHH